MSESKVEIKIPDEMIRGMVISQMAASMSAAGGSDKLLEMIVRKALTEPANSYGRETRFDAALREMLDKVAREVIEEWIASRPWRRTRNRRSSRSSTTSPLGSRTSIRRCRS